MSQGNCSLCRIVSVALAIVLAGVYLLYNYYDATLKERIAAQKVELTRTNATVKDLEGKLASAGDLEKQLRAEISDRASQHAMALKALQRMLDSSESAKRALRAEMKDAKAKSAAALSAAQQEAAQALADLQRKYDEATVQVTDLSAKVEELKQAQVKSDREHEAQLAETAAK